MILGLTGKAGAGKDAAAEFLVDVYGFKRIGFADALRTVLAALNPIIFPANDPVIRIKDGLAMLGGWDELKRPCPSDAKCVFCVKHPELPSIHLEVRYLMQNFGTEVMRAMVPTFWIDRVADKVTDGGNWVITDCRFDNEAEAIEAWGGKVVEIMRPRIAAIRSHASEAGIKPELIYGTIQNDGTLQDLYDKMSELVTYWIPEPLSRYTTLRDQSGSAE